jgi:hypothetical protein
LVRHGRSCATSYLVTQRSQSLSYYRGDTSQTPHRDISSLSEEREIFQFSQHLVPALSGLARVYASRDVSDVANQVTDGHVLALEDHYPLSQKRLEINGLNGNVVMRRELFTKFGGQAVRDGPEQQPILKRRPLSVSQNPVPNLKTTRPLDLIDKTLRIEKQQAQSP